MKAKNIQNQNKAGIKTLLYLFFRNSTTDSLRLNNSAPLIIKKTGTPTHPRNLKIIAKYQKLQNNHSGLGLANWPPICVAIIAIIAKNLKKSK
jgi:hypothetical protein